MTTTNYIWDEQNYLAEADETNTINVVYTNEPQQYGNLISTRLPVSGTPTSFYHHFDALGSTRQLSTSTGLVSDTAIYDAWGNAIDRTGTTAVMLLWVGELGYYFDPDTGLVYVRARIYGPAVARWLSTDPVAQFEFASPYVYSLNAPCREIDPSGSEVTPKCPKCETPVIVRRPLVTDVKAKDFSANIIGNRLGADKMNIIGFDLKPAKDRVTKGRDVRVLYVFATYLVQCCKTQAGKVYKIKKTRIVTKPVTKVTAVFPLSYPETIKAGDLDAQVKKAFPFPFWLDTSFNPDKPSDQQTCLIEAGPDTFGPLLPDKS